MGTNVWVAKHLWGQVCPLFSSCFHSSSLFPWYIRPRHFSQYVFISPQHMLVPNSVIAPRVFGNLRHSHCSRMCSFPFLPLRVTPHIHRSVAISFISIRFSCFFVVSHVSAPWHCWPDDCSVDQFVQPASTRIVISVSMPHSSSTLVPRYLKWATLASSSPRIGFLVQSVNNWNPIEFSAC